MRYHYIAIFISDRVILTNHILHEPAPRQLNVDSV